MNSQDKQSTSGGRRPRPSKRWGGRAHEHSDSLERFFTIAAIADLLGVCERTVRRWIEREELARHNFGSITRIGQRDLEAFIDRARRGPPAQQSRDPLDDDFYTAEEVAELLGVCVKTVRRRLDSEVLSAHHFGGLIRIARTDLQDFVSRSRCD